MMRDIGLLILRLCGLYCVAVSLLGPGRLSIDAKLGRR